jgi:hypothetical protein
MEHWFKRSKCPCQNDRNSYLLTMVLLCLVFRCPVDWCHQSLEVEHPAEKARHPLGTRRWRGHTRLARRWVRPLAGRTSTGDRSDRHGSPMVVFQRLVVDRSRFSTRVGGIVSRCRGEGRTHVDLTTRDFG